MEWDKDLYIVVVPVVEEKFFLLLLTFLKMVH
jgi:hypothetical protein